MFACPSAPCRPKTARELLKAAGLTAASQWRKVAPTIEGDTAYKALGDDRERLRVFTVRPWAWRFDGFGVQG